MALPGCCLTKCALLLAGLCTERQIKVSTRLHEISSCSCLSVLPGPAWVLLNKICKPLFAPQYLLCSHCFLHGDKLAAPAAHFDAVNQVEPRTRARFERKEMRNGPFECAGRKCRGLNLMSRPRVFITCCGLPARAREATEKELLVILHTSLTVKNDVIGTKDRLKSPFYFSKGFRVAKSHHLSSLLFPPPSPESRFSCWHVFFSSVAFERLPRPKEWMDG